MVSLRKIKEKIKMAKGIFFKTKCSNKRHVVLGRLDNGRYLFEFKKRRFKENCKFVFYTKSMQRLRFTVDEECMEAIAHMYFNILREQVRKEEKEKNTANHVVDIDVKVNMDYSEIARNSKRCQN